MLRPGGAVARRPAKHPAQHRAAVGPERIWEGGPGPSRQCGAASPAGKCQVATGSSTFPHSLRTIPGLPPAPHCASSAWHPDSPVGLQRPGKKASFLLPLGWGTTSKGAQGLLRTLCLGVLPGSAPGTTHCMLKPPVQKRGHCRVLETAQSTLPLGKRRAICKPGLKKTVCQVRAAESRVTGSQGGIIIPASEPEHSMLAQSTRRKGTPRIKAKTVRTTSGA